MESYRDKVRLGWGVDLGGWVGRDARSGFCFGNEDRHRVTLCCLRHIRFSLGIGFLGERGLRSEESYGEETRKDAERNDSGSNRLEAARS